jgi:hypothetical protein
MSKVYKTWRDFPLGDWRWPNFTPQELASKREGELLIDEASMESCRSFGPSSASRCSLRAHIDRRPTTRQSAAPRTASTVSAKRSTWS